jgi:hypothetical protein
MMDTRDKRRKFVTDTIHLFETYPYNLEEWARYFYEKSFDVRYGDDPKLSNLLLTIGTMDAGEPEEFGLSKDEILDMLKSYLEEEGLGGS